MGTILIVDDDPKIRRLMRRMLAPLEHDIAEAEDGRAGSAYLRSRAVDLVVTDIFMPARDGLELIREIKSERPGLKVIAISGGGTAFPGLDLLGLARSLGADRAFVKPFDVDAIRAAAGALLTAGAG